MKVKLRNQGVDPEATQDDPVHWLQGGKYVPFTRKDWERIQNGAVKL